MRTFLNERRVKFKEDMIVEKSKMKEMSFREKLEYIREYYFWHLLFGGLTIAIVIWALNFYVFNPPPQLGLGVAFYGVGVARPILDRLENDMTAALIDEDAHYVVVSTNFFQTEADPEFTMAMMQQFSALVTAQQIDVMIVHPDVYMSLFAQGFALDLRYVFDETQLYNKRHIVEYGFLVDFNHATGEAMRQPEYYPFGLSLRYSTYFTDQSLEFADWVLMILVNSPRVEMAKEMALLVVEY